MADGGPLQAAMFSIPTASDDSCEKDMDIRIDEEKNIAVCLIWWVLYYWL